MTKEEAFRQFAENKLREADVLSDEIYALIRAAMNIGIDEYTAETIINEVYKSISWNEESDTDETNGEYVFKSAITRGGAILTPEVIIIDSFGVTNKKRKKNLITFSEVTIPFSKIAAVGINTSLIGTDIVIDCIGEGCIYVENFTKSDAKEIKRLIEERL